jgi:hypothetical protein
MGSESSQTTDRSTAFSRAWTDFHDAIDGLQEFLESVAPHLSKIEADESSAATALRQSQRDELRRVLTRVQRGLRVALEGSDQEMTPEDSATAQASINIVGGTASKTTRVNLSDDPEVNEAVLRILRRRPIRRRKKMPILLRSVLTMSVAAFEVLIGQLAEARYRLHPRAMGTDRKEFSLEELSTFEVLEDATTALIERRTDELMRRGLEGWAQWHKQETSVRFDEIALDWEATAEVFERRHLAVHHGGRVSPQYHRRLGAASPPVGSTLDLDEAYVQESLDRIGVLGGLLIGCVWAQLLPDDQREAGSLLDARVYALMERGRWSSAQHIARVAQERLQLAEDDRYRLRLNELLSIKRDQGLESIRVAAEQIDTSALSHQYKLVRLALLDRHREAIEEAKVALAANEIDKSSLQTWLALDELRHLPEFRALAGLSPMDLPPKTPNALAADLGISATRLRRWLRREHPRDPVNVGHRWTLTPAVVEAAHRRFGSHETR